MHEAGIPYSLVASLTDEDMQAIADEAQALVLSEPLEKIVEFVARLYLARKEPIMAPNESLNDADRFSGGEEYDYEYFERTYHASRAVIEEALPHIRETYHIDVVPPVLLEREIKKAYEQILLDEAYEQYLSRSEGGQDEQKPMCQDSETGTGL